MKQLEKNFARREIFRTALAPLFLLFVACGASNAQNVQQKTINGKRFTIAIVDPRSDTLRLFWKAPNGQPFRTLDALQKQLVFDKKELVFAMNAGIFTKSFAPEGLHVEDGRVLVPLNTNKCNRPCGNFYVQPNGVFFIDEKNNAQIVPTSDFHHRARIALQSGPLLAVDGRILPSFPAQSQNRTVRNGVGVTRDGRVILAVAHDALNMHDFAQALLDEGADDVLYLDGAISGALSRYGRSGRPPYAGMLAVTSK